MVLFLSSTSHFALSGLDALFDTIQGRRARFASRLPLAFKSRAFGAAARYDEWFVILCERSEIVQLV